MKDIVIYLKWIAILCAVMAAFCLAIFAVGYKDLSVARVATVVVLLIASAGCGIAYRKKSTEMTKPKDNASRKDAQ
ncbi:MAG: hypothetical protein RR381_05105 [Raoultibacter sp.]